MSERHQSDRRPAARDDVSEHRGGAASRRVGDAEPDDGGMRGVATDHRAADGHHGSGQHGSDHGGSGHGDHAAAFRDRFWLSLVLSVPVVFASHLVAELLGYEVAPGATWMPPVLGTLVFVYGGSPFLTGAVTELRARQPGMMTLVALAISVAFVASGLTTLGIGGLDLDFWWELVLLVVIMLLGHWLEMRALGQATGALGALAELLPDSAERIEADGTMHPVALTDLAVGDLVLVRSGGRVPADGVVIDGAADVDESMITGESATVRRAAGERVVAGTVATDSALRVRVSAVGEDTALAGIARLVEQAQSSRSRAQALADRAAAALFWFALGAGILTFVVWSLIGEATTAVERTVTVLVIACPHALGLAIPLVIAISTAMSAKAGILVKDRLALERMRTVDAVLFDKTGTLTKGSPAVTEVVPVAGVSRAELLALAASAELDSEHPLARAVVAAARESGEVPAAQDFRSLTGRGVQAVVDGATIAVGGPALLREHDIEPPPDLTAATDEWTGRGAGVLHVLRDGVVIGAVALADEIRPESREAVAALHAEGVRVVMITGDTRGVAEAVAGELGVDEVFAEVLPADKDGAVVELQQRGHRVAMVGDGVNDAPALARADVGIAIGAGTDVAVESAGVVLASDDPRAVLAVRRLSMASYRKMWQNLAWATAYNLITVPLAAGVLAGVGFVLPPALGAVAMSLSTIVVALNAQLLRRVRLTEAAAGR
ncbi:MULTISPECIES: heavy metal translocating P-type ATPase [Actinoalloteichus]|uniref:Copper/silver-translocating P-type ATPase n=1 Tax=Actinoalloteichus fjordicus TaxID=1612552 RepID=A0AAC9L8B2_9PSEU|nr:MULTISPECIES: heavy metal translocating P-type ATPase [Actinoalloteichus]APU13248.1 copper/silver-translocating P-type ATPase [Actinoalloteichus fjordicus]APU19199.1 copper/silver-translocating P-type ATPase [Actinoalloteichus sp. GBA129-24]